LVTAHERKKLKTKIFKRRKGRDIYPFFLAFLLFDFWFSAAPGADKIYLRANKNPYRIAMPFIWCSNNLAVNFITHGLLYEKMTGDRRYHEIILAHRDWLLGRNPWGISAFVGIPSEGGNTP
jgi:hypothetical protein